MGITIVLSSGARSVSKALTVAVSVSSLLDNWWRGPSAWLWRPQPTRQSASAVHPEVRRSFRRWAALVQTQPRAMVWFRRRNEAGDGPGFCTVTWYCVDRPSSVGAGVRTP
jgi:hypothetical protein